MALIRNYTNSNGVINREFNSGTTSYGVPNTITPQSAFKNRYLGAVEKKSGTPNGYVHPGSWVMPLVAGGMSSYRQMEVSIVETLAMLAGGINAEANLSGSINITQAQLDQIANLLASISGSITTTDAQLAAVSALQASITASMTITDAQLGAIIDLMASLDASFLLTNAGNFATANISADMSVTTGTATPAQIAAEVWDTILADHLITGSTGRTLSEIVTMTEPITIVNAMFDEPVEPGYSLKSSLRLMLSALAGKLSGAGMSTVKIRDINDTVTRITADVDTNGNRDVVTTDVL